MELFYYVFVRFFVCLSSNVQSVQLIPTTDSILRSVKNEEKKTKVDFNVALLRNFMISLKVK